MAYNPLRNFGLKSLSVGLAVLLWFAVGGEKIVERSLRVPLEFQNTPDDVEIVGDTPTVVDVRVRGGSSLLGNLSAGDVVAVMDLSSAKPGRRLFQLTADEVRAPSGVEVKSVTPSSAALVFERSVTKRVPLIPSIEGQPAAGFAVEKVTTEPADVEVAGPESAIRGVQHAVTEGVSIEGASATVRETVTIGTPNSAARINNSRSARVVVEIAATRTERTLANIPVRMIHLESGRTARVSPTWVVVTVRGAEDAIRRLTTDAIEATVDLAGRGPGRYDLTVVIAPTRAFSVSRIDPAQVQIAIK